jgi:heptosyltransferase I
MNKSYSRILVIKPSSFGDIIQANPVLTALKKSFPGCSVTWLVADKWQDALDLFTGLDGRIVWRRDSLPGGYIEAIKKARAGKFDLVIDLQGLARSAFMAFMSGAKKVIGVPGMKELSWMLVKEPFPKSKGMNAVYRSLESVRFLTSEKHEPEFSLSIPAAAAAAAEELLKQHGIAGGEKLVGLVPLVRGLSKQWPLEYYVELARLVKSEMNDIKMLVFGAKSVFKLPEDKAIIDLCGKTSIPVMAALMKRCKAVVGGDTGPVHLASALDIPVAVIWGGSDINETAPVGKKAHLLKKEYECGPCRTRPSCKDFQCLKDIKPAEVFEALKKWIN